MQCTYYSQSEISGNFPLEKCDSCKYYTQDVEDGFYTCQLLANNVQHIADMILSNQNVATAIENASAGEVLNAIENIGRRD